MSDEQDNGDIRKGIKLDEEGQCIACHGTEEVETSEGWNLGCSYCSNALDKANARIAELEDQLQDSRSMNADFDSYHCCPECFSQNVEQVHPAGADDYGAFKCHDCDHQGEIGEDFPSGTKVRHRIAQLNERVGEMKGMIEASLSFIKTLPEDSMGLDPHIGYSYRDEMISRFEGALNKEQP